MSALYEGLRLNTASPLFYNAFFALRRLIYAMTCVVCQGVPIFQIQALSLQCIFLLIYLGAVQPFSKLMSNRMEVFNEITILMASYHLFLLTDFMPDVKLQYNVGYGLIAVTTLNIVVNMGLIVVMGVITMRQNIRNLRKKWPEIKQKILDKLKRKTKGEYEMQKNELTQVQILKKIVQQKNEFLVNPTDNLSLFYDDSRIENFVDVKAKGPTTNPPEVRVQSLMDIDEVPDIRNEQLIPFESLPVTPTSSSPEKQPSFLMSKQSLFPRNKTGFGLNHMKSLQQNSLKIERGSVDENTGTPSPLGQSQINSTDKKLQFGVENKDKLITALKTKKAKRGKEEEPQWLKIYSAIKTVKNSRK